MERFQRILYAIADAIIPLAAGLIIIGAAIWYQLR
jgi:hypothetical protein